MAAPKPGIYPGVPEEIYESWPAARSSTLRLFRRSAAHARQQMMEPENPSESKILGQAEHCAVLEPDRFTRDYVAAPRADKRTKAGREKWKEFEERHKDQTFLLPKDYELCLSMREAVWSHPTASKLLEATIGTELSILWVDPETQVTVKARLDAISNYAGWTAVVDLKTARDASPQGFSRACATYGLHHQASVYLEGLDVLSPRRRRFFWIVVEKSPPYVVAVYEPDQTALDQGRREFRRNIMSYQAAMTQNIWPGYGDGVQVLSLPHWAVKEDRNDR